MRYIAFFCALPHSEADYLEQTLQEYASVTEYLIGMEVSLDSHLDTSGQHFHFFTDMSPKDYHTFSIRVFRNKYHLRGQARKGLSRQYGKIKEIQDLNKMAAYTIKDNNIRTNMSSNIVQHYQNLAFEKVQLKDLKREIYEHLKSHNITDIYKLRQNIIEFFRTSGEKNQRSLSRSYINNLLVGYMMYGDPKHFTIGQIEEYIFLH